MHLCMTRRAGRDRGGRASGTRQTRLLTNADQQVRQQRPSCICHWRCAEASRQSCVTFAVVLLQPAVSQKRCPARPNLLKKLKLMLQGLWALSSAVPPVQMSRSIQARQQRS